MTALTVEDVQTHIMTVSRNGQVSIPAETRARWNTRKVIVVDMGDRVVVSPMPDDPIAAVRGKYAGRGPASDEVRKAMRAEEARDDERRR